MLAYLFWHWPEPDVRPETYVERLVAFHRALAEAPPPGFAGSRVLAIDGAPWTPGPAYEDWYLVESFAALGALNEAAVTAARLAPHDGVARLAAGGAGAVYRRLHGGAADTRSDVVHWFAKPAGTGYADFLARLHAAEAWQRQLVLGPAPEFAVLGPAPGGVETIAVRARLVHEGRAIEAPRGAVAAPARELRLAPVGVVRSPLTDRAAAPMQGDEGAPDAIVELAPEYAPALEGVTVGDELILVTWLHEADRAVLQTHPRSDPNRPLTGVFATRSPDRPNPLGLHRVTVRGRAGSTLTVGPLEAIDGTPVVDLKPVMGEGDR